ncbi:LADA_0B11386g1_1 [Lachancea dasiensis]|uniref:PAN2-PAN3 deadenylation complex subunit PAN3 n=1 Tax=Lachancea dasiensis TaxID=1072105 RepID=A0A1G4IVP6_9SACH|nr:LADA_0B11386g1_1 [Lachancea dasiensis]
MDKANAEWAKDIPCKNITIYGFCKYENEGCVFNHGNEHDNSKYAENPKPQPQQQQQQQQQLLQQQQQLHQLQLNAGGSMNMKFNAKTASSFTPSKVLNSKNSTSTAIKAEKVAKALQSAAEQPTVSSPQATKTASFAPAFNPYAANFTPIGSAGASTPPPSAPALQGFNPYSASAGGMATPGEEINPIQAPGGFAQSAPAHFGHDTPGRKTNFPSIYPPTHSILQYHLYAPDPPLHLKVPLKPNERTAETLFIPNDLRESLVKKNHAALQVFPSGGNLPEIVGDYFGLVPLEFHNRTMNSNRYQGHQNSLYKVFSNFDGKIYIMRRIHDVKIKESVQIFKPYQAWKRLVNANATEVRDAFLTRAFGDASLCVVHDYFPQSCSLYEHHFVSFSPVPITQDLLWSYLVQLCSAIQAAHSLNLAFNNICLEKVIVTGSPGRIKIGDTCVHDVLHFQHDNDIVQQQEQDYIDLGKLLMELSAKILGSQESTTVDSCAVDEEFKKVLHYLLDTTKPKSFKELLVLFAHKILPVTSALQTYAEYTESILSRELENARLFRLMCKLNFIFGRIESRIDINWSDSGAKFPIILFYDYVFHQTDESGKPVMDLTHVLRCLNKLDAGVGEKLMLVTPDEMNCIIISFKELKDLIDTTFRSMSQ